ncbi:hypothetical protein [Rummeliibacillus sp. TYF-LIM-RU47]|uniref:hypothetical protein n=1 Tax=Rummeliibacillus sp. TYF-LIM-RU47 TaxID=2608406 RepID=UPI0012385AE6|nr:hypothetical protein [Rummeliibacillus sp. TYF-LIM-RU47]
MNELNFRPRDLEKAKKAHDCLDTLHKQLAIHIERGNYAIAQICIEEMNTFLCELCRMRHTKKEHDRLIKVAKTMNQRGIKSKVVARYV